MKVYAVYEYRVYHNTSPDFHDERDEYIERLFDSEDKAINFIQERISKFIGSEFKAFNKVPSKEFIRECVFGIPYFKSTLYDYYYFVSEKRVY